MAGSTRRVLKGRAFERLLFFTDGVVAVAVTILALPIIDIAEPSASETMGQVLLNNIGSIAALIFTFIVVTVMWLVHNRVVNVAEGFDGLLLWLNIAWLIGIILLPWPSRLLGDSMNPGDFIGENAQANGDIALLYWLLLAAISLTGALMSRHIFRNPDLWATHARDEAQALGSPIARVRGIAFATLCVLIGIVWFINPSVGQWLPLLLIPLSIILRRVQHDRHAEHPEHTEHPDHTAGPESPEPDAQPS